MEISRQIMFLTFLIFKVNVINSNEQENLSLRCSLSLKDDLRLFEKNLEMRHFQPQNNQRSKRSANGKWKKQILTWRFNKGHKKYLNDSHKIRQRIDRAFQEWQYHIPLLFKEVTATDQEVDIEISFQSDNHAKVDLHEFGGDSLAHAFYPEMELSGDIHLRENINWEFDSNPESPNNSNDISIFRVIIHEIGHSLGLKHSDQAKAVMNEFYDFVPFTLTDDDIQKIQQIYGIPENYKSIEYSTTEINTKTFTEALTTTTEIIEIIPDKCHTSYDAIATINGELFIFKGQFLFRPDSSDTSAIKIRRLWPEIPENFTNIDAVYQNSDNKILVFIGRRLFIFSSDGFQGKLSFKDLGLSKKVEKIDAIFQLKHKRRTSIMIDNSSWLFDAEHLKVLKRDKKTIHYFKGMDTGFYYKKKLYYFGNEYYYEIDLKKPSIIDEGLSARKFMKCDI